MRILHTTDWHLGRTLHGRSRSAEHEAFLDELVDLASDVDLVLLSGDVYETTTPPIDAEELYFDVLARLGDGGKRAVVVIAGNHDSPDRLTASAPLCERHGVWVLGRPGDEVRGREGAIGAAGVRLLSSGPSTLTVGLPSGEKAAIVAVPYPSEARMSRVLSQSLDPFDLQAAYERRIASMFTEAAASVFSQDAVNLLTTHLAIRSCMPSPSERILIGGAWQVAGHVFPATAQYVALGHLHLAQAVEDAPTVARYAGAPLSMRFSERDFPREHVIVDLVPGGSPQIERIPIRAGRPLVVWEVVEIEEVEAGVEAGLHPTAWIDLIVRRDEPLTHAQLARIKRLPRDFVRITAAPTEPEEAEPGDVSLGRRSEMSLSELFSAFYRQQVGRDPSPDLVSLLLSIGGGEEKAEAEAEAEAEDGCAQDYDQVGADQLADGQNGGDEQVGDEQHPDDRDDDDRSSDDRDGGDLGSDDRDDDDRSNDERDGGDLGGDDRDGGEKDDDDQGNADRDGGDLGSDDRDDDERSSDDRDGGDLGSDDRDEDERSSDDRDGDDQSGGEKDGGAARNRDGQRSADEQSDEDRTSDEQSGGGGGAQGADEDRASGGGVFVEGRDGGEGPVGGAPDPAVG